MSRVHLVGGEKGGVGKSVFARLLCQWLLDRSVNLSALDADLCQQALLRGYGKYCRAVDLAAFDSADQIMDLALGADEEVVVDLPAQSLGQLCRWLVASDVQGLATETGVRLVFWHVTDGGHDSVRALETALSHLRAPVELVVVCNQRWSQDFSHLEGSPAFQQLRARGGRVITLPLLEAQVMYKTEGRGTSLALALHESQNGAGTLTPMEGRRAARWLAMAYSQMDPILLDSLRAAGTTMATGGRQAALTSQPAQVEAASRDELAVSASADPVPSSQAEGAGPPIESPQGQAASVPSVKVPPAGTKWIDGAATWTEAGENCLVHHVRCY